MPKEEIRKEIKAAIQQALERGESLNEVVVSLLQAGYEKQDIFEVANEFLLGRKEAVVKLRELEKPKSARPEKLEKPEKPKKHEEKPKEPEEKKLELEEKEKLEEKQARVGMVTKGKAKEYIFFIASLLFIFYYILVLLIFFSRNKYLIYWLLLALPSFLSNIFSLGMKKKLKKYIYIVFLALAIASIPVIFAFILLTSTVKFVVALKLLLLSKEFYYIIEAHLLSYVLLIIALILRILKK